MSVTADGYERVLGFDFVKEFLAVPVSAAQSRQIRAMHLRGGLAALRDRRQRAGYA